MSARPEDFSADRWQDDHRRVLRGGGRRRRLRPRATAAAVTTPPRALSTGSQALPPERRERRASISRKKARENHKKTAPCLEGEGEEEVAQHRAAELAGDGGEGGGEEGGDELRRVRVWGGVIGGLAGSARLAGAWGGDGGRGRAVWVQVNGRGRTRRLRVRRGRCVVRPRHLRRTDRERDAVRVHTTPPSRAAPRRRSVPQRACMRGRGRRKLGSLKGRANDVGARRRNEAALACIKVVTAKPPHSTATSAMDVSTCSRSSTALRGAGGGARSAEGGKGRRAVPYRRRSAERRKRGSAAQAPAGGRVVRVSGARRSFLSTKLRHIQRECVTARASSSSNLHRHCFSLRQARERAQG